LFNGSVKSIGNSEENLWVLHLQTVTIKVRKALSSLTFLLHLPFKQKSERNILPGKLEGIDPHCIRIWTPAVRDFSRK